MTEINNDILKAHIHYYKNESKRYKKEIDRLKAELEQERSLKETYLTCYKAKHEDIDGELFKLKQTLIEIKDIINGFAKQDILTFPDLEPKENYKLIQKQCGEPIIQILQIIRESEIKHES